MRGAYNVSTSRTTPEPSPEQETTLDRAKPAERWAAFEDPAETQGFTMISNAVLRDPRVSMAAKTVYGLLKSYAWQDPFCFPGQQRLADDLGVHRNTVGKLIKELEAVELVRSERRGLNKTNLYTFLHVRPRTDPDAQPGVQPDARSSVHQDATVSVQDEDAGLRIPEDEDAGGTVLPDGNTVGSDRKEAVSARSSENRDELDSSSLDNNATKVVGRDGGSMITEKERQTNKTFAPETEEAMRVIYARLKGAGIDVPRWCYAAMKCDMDRGWYGDRPWDDPEGMAELLIAWHEEVGEVDHAAAWVDAEDVPEF